MNRKTELLYELAHNAAVEENYSETSRERMKALKAMLTTVVRTANQTKETPK